jgi:hypothetical protein
MRAGEKRRHHAALELGEDTGALEAGGVHNGDHVVDLVLERAAPVECDV